MSAWQKLDHQHVWHPYTQMHNAPLPVPLVGAEGIWLHTAHGKRLVDGISSWWVTLHGHNVPELNAALFEQAGKMAHVMFAGFSHEPGASLAGALAERTKLPKVFYSDNGSTAVEVAMKMAFQSWHNRGQTQRNIFVAFEGAYHGDTFGAMAASGTALFHGVYRHLLCKVRRAHGTTCPSQRHAAPCNDDCPDRLANILAHEGERVAAVIIEPMVQGAGGMRFFTPEQLRAVATAAKAYGIPLIADEVFTGFGRTGRLFACEHAGILPDIMCLSKALTGGYMPMGATLASQDIYDAFASDDRTKTLFHGHSFTGNPLACALGVASLKLLDARKSLQRVQALEALYAERLAGLRHHGCVAAVRQMGSIAVIELHDPSHTGYLSNLGPKLLAAFLNKGVLLRPLGSVLYFLPPLCITDSEAHDVFDVIDAVLGDLRP